MNKRALIVIHYLLLSVILFFHTNGFAVKPGGEEDSDTTESPPPECHHQGACNCPTYHQPATEYSKPENGNSGANMKTLLSDALENISKKDSNATKTAPDSGKKTTDKQAKRPIAFERFMRNSTAKKITAKKITAKDGIDTKTATESEEQTDKSSSLLSRVLELIKQEKKKSTCTFIYVLQGLHSTRQEQGALEACQLLLSILSKQTPIIDITHIEQLFPLLTCSLQQKNYKLITSFNEELIDDNLENFHDEKELIKQITTILKMPNVSPTRYREEYTDGHILCESFHGIDYSNFFFIDICIEEGKVKYTLSLPEYNEMLVFEKWIRLKVFIDTYLGYHMAYKLDLHLFKKPD